jgi:tyrosine phenol-lyase
VTVESIESVHDNRESVWGLRMVHEPKHLRFFQARFEKL